MRLFALAGFFALFVACRHDASTTVSTATTTTAPAASSVVAWAEASTAPSEEVLRIPLEEHPDITLETTVFRPAGAGPFPLVVMNHGAIGKRDPAPRWRPVEIAQWFVSRGFIVAVPMRRGNAGSGGDWAEGYGPCESADYSNANRESASDIRAAMNFMAKRADVDAHHVVLHGMSAGGFAVLALASAPQKDPPRIVGVLSFAGGRGSLSNDGVTRHNCSPDALVASAARFGETIAVPTLWLYAENDHFFPPPLAHRMFDAFSAHAKGASFVALPAFAREGHSIGWQAGAIPLWEHDVAQFLARVCDGCALAR